MEMKEILSTLISGDEESGLEPFVPEPVAVEEPEHLAQPILDALFDTSPSTKRQAWIEDATKALAARFAKLSFAVPANVRVSIGWPKGSHGKGRAIGQCWYAEGSTDNHHELFISPELSDGARILDVLAHELSHAIAGKDAGHKAPFKRVAEAVGLTGQMTATVAGPEFETFAREHVAQFGAYPAGSLGVPAGKKQTNRMLKVTCPTCGYVARTAKSWLDEVGAPICPADMIEMEAA
jgi:SprT-like family